MTLIAANCGPPDGWVLHTVRVGETLKTLSLLYRVSEADLRNANCRGEMDFVVAGEKLYVPNVATSTPTFTPTATPKPSSTPKGTATVTGGGSGSGTVTATNSPTTLLSDLVGPDNSTISGSLLNCYQNYGIYVKDPDGITEVKIIYTFDGSLPEYDSAVGAGRYKQLSKTGTDHYELIDALIDTGGKSPTVTIRYRFTVKDSLGNVTAFPTNDALVLNDSVICTDKASTGNVTASPNGATITALASCPQTYTFDAADENGIKEVKLWYTITDGDGAPTSSSMAKQIPLATANGAGTGGVYTLANFTVDTTGFAPAPGPIVVNFDFSVYDKLGNESQFTGGEFDDTFGCTP